MIFTSLVHANEHVNIHNVRRFVMEAYNVTSPFIRSEGSDIKSTDLALNNYVYKKMCIHH